MNIQTQIRNEFNRVDALARSIFPKYQEAGIPNLTFFIKGTTAGWARYAKWEVSINAHIAGQNVEQMKDTVSHEIAHMVAFYVYGERGHGWRWKHVHRMLGGNGQRCYDAAANGITTIPGRRTNWYLYRCPTSGVESWVGPRHHSGLQKGRYVSLTNNAKHVKILAEHFTGQSKTKG